MMKVGDKERYHVNHAKTERFRNSAVPFLQRKNENIKIKKKFLLKMLSYS